MALGLGVWVAEIRWTAEAEESGRQRLKALLAEHERSDLFVKHPNPTDLHLQFTGLLATENQNLDVLFSVPTGAEVRHRGKVLGTTPYISMRPAPEGNFEIRTPFRSAQISGLNQVIALSSNSLVKSSRGLGLVGLLLFLFGFHSRKGEAEPNTTSSSSESQESQESQGETTPSAAPNPNHLFDEFKQIERDDEGRKGSMGTVYQARSTDPQDLKVYALKVLLEKWSESDEFRERFARESAICQQLTHPNVVRVYAHGDKNGKLWMVMDYIEGQDLKDLIKERPRTETELLPLAKALCSGLAHAHQLGIIHRDLKPENIMIREDGTPVIADFGLARAQHYKTITQANTTLGTPAYMAPEQVQGQGRDPRSDLYSLGCILYECLTGKPPFEGTAVQVIIAQMTKQPTPLGELVEVNQELVNVIERLMKKSKEERFASAQEALEALSNLQPEPH